MVRPRPTAAEEADPLRPRPTASARSEREARLAEEEKRRTAEKEAALGSLTAAAEKSDPVRPRPTASARREREARLAEEKKRRTAQKEAALRSFLDTTRLSPGHALDFVQQANWDCDEALRLFRVHQSKGKSIEADALDNGKSIIEDALRNGKSTIEDALGPYVGKDPDLEPTSAEKKNAIKSFVEITGEGLDMAVEYLEVVQWNIKEAVEVYMKKHDSTAKKELSMDSDFIMNPPIDCGITRNYTLRRDVYNGLKSYQQEGLQWFWELHCSGRGGILGDDMGLGKTRQVAAFLCGLFESELIHRVLILVPPILMNQWIKELKIVGLQEQTHIFKEAKTRSNVLLDVVKNGGLLLCSNGLVTREWSSLNIFHKWDYVVVDEAHTFNNPRAKKVQNLKKITCSHRLLITGTPMQNSLKELHALLDLCCPDVLGKFDEFKENFLDPIVYGNFKSSTNEELIESSQAASKLRAAIKPYLLRRMKTEISLPQKTEFTVWLELTPYQQRLYKTFLRTNKFKNAGRGTVIVAAMILQKICNHPCKLSKEDRLSKEDLDKDQRKLLGKMIRKLEMDVPRKERNEDKYNFSCKTEFVLKLIERLYGHHKVLIFAQTRETLDEIEEALERNWYKFLRIDGTTTDLERKELVEHFKQEDGPQIFLLSTRVGGVGLDLPIASRAVIVDPAWNPSIDNQCADRIYRIGQQKGVIIYRLIATNTVEQYTYDTQLFKAGLFKASTENEDCKRYISKEMKEDLLKIPESFSTSKMQRLSIKETMKEQRSEETQKEMDVLKESGFGDISIYNRMFSKTLKLPLISDGNWRVKKHMRLRSGRRFGDCVLGGADCALRPKDWQDAVKRAPPVKEQQQLEDAKEQQQLEDAEGRIAFLRTQINRHYRRYNSTEGLFAELSANHGDGDTELEIMEKELAELEADLDNRAKGG